MIEAMAPVISDQLLARTDEAFTFTFIEEVRGYDGFREHLLCIYSTRLEIALRNRRDHPEVLLVPAVQRIGIGGAEEEPADPGHARRRPTHRVATRR